VEEAPIRVQEEPVHIYGRCVGLGVFGPNLLWSVSQPLICYNPLHDDYSNVMYLVNHIVQRGFSLKLKFFFLFFILIVWFFCNSICGFDKRVDLWLRLDDIDDYTILEIFEIEIENWMNEWMSRDIYIWYDIVKILIEVVMIKT